jgi:hypothetical protein
MEITHEDIQKARRISQAIQKYLEMSNDNGLRAADVYPYLAREGLVEVDRHGGLHFKQFLHHLKDNDLLYLIPQCQYRSTRSKKILEWLFYQVAPKPEKVMPAEVKTAETTEAVKVFGSKMSDEDIEIWSQAYKEEIEGMPKTDASKLTPQKLEIRQTYPRAYESWSPREIEIMILAYHEFQKVDKIAVLLKRQPSAVKRHLEKYLPKS